MMQRPTGGWWRRFDCKAMDLREVKACTYLQVMGMFTLWVGWYGFNAGSMRCMNAICSDLVGLIAWNTTLAACSAGLGACLFCCCAKPQLDIGFLCNGIL